MILSQLHPVLHSFPASWVHVYARSIEFWIRDRISQPSLAELSAQEQPILKPSLWEVREMPECIGRESVCDRERCARVCVHEKPQPDGHPTLVFLSLHSTPLHLPYLPSPLSPGLLNMRAANHGKERRCLRQRPPPLKLANNHRQGALKGPGFKVAHQWWQGPFYCCNRFVSSTAFTWHSFHPPPPPPPPLPITSKCYRFGFGLFCGVSFFGLKCHHVTKLLTQTLKCDCQRKIIKCFHLFWEQ